MSETTMARLVKVLRANWQTKPEVRVRAILTALREPDEGMTLAGLIGLATHNQPEVKHWRQEARAKLAAASTDAEHYDAGAASGIATGIGCSDGRQANAVWQAMVDHILADDGANERHTRPNDDPIRP